MVKNGLIKSTQKQLLVIRTWLVTKLNFTQLNFKKQDCEGFQLCSKFIPEELAIHLIIDIKTAKPAECKIKLGFNQVDPLMSKQESIGFRLKKVFFE